MSRYKPYPKYKDSGVEWIGAVPEGWRVVPLKRCFECLDGKRVPLNSEERAPLRGDIPYWGSGGVVDHINQFIFDEPLVLLGEDGAPFFDRNRPVAYFVEGKSWVNNHIHVLRPTTDYPPWWLVHALNSVEYRLYIDGSTRDKLTQDDMVGITLALPPTAGEAAQVLAVAEAEIDRIDVLIAKKTRFIELLREKRQALITHAVTKGLDPNVPMKDSGVEWIGEVPVSWSVCRLRDVCSSISTGPFGTALGIDDYIEGGIPVINPSHISDGVCTPDYKVSVSRKTAARLQPWILQSGDVITARRGELGRAAIVTSTEEGWICGTGSLRIRPNAQKASSSYLYAVLQTSYARAWLDRESVGTTMPNLNESLMSNLPIAIPPDLTEQHAVLANASVFIKKMDLLADKTARSIELLRERRAAFITAAVTGQIDLRDEATAREAAAA